MTTDIEIAAIDEFKAMEKRCEQTINLAQDLETLLKKIIAAGKPHKNALSLNPMDNLKFQKKCECDKCVAFDDAERYLLTIS